MATISRATYAALYGPTKGDKVRLGDTDLIIEVEEDHTCYGDELLVGEARNIRENIMASSRFSEDEALDVIFTNALVIDPVLGVVKTHIGVKDGLIAGLGRNAAAETRWEGLKIGTNTGVVPCEGLIVTPGGIDTHVHLVTPRLVAEALSSGITTLIASGSGGIWDIGTNPRRHVEMVFAAFEAFPVNLGLLGRGSSTRRGPLIHNVGAGVCGFKIHEDVGATPQIIDACLEVAEEHDVAVCLHTDGLNESGFVEDTISAIAGRAVHAFHVEGTGGGHVPDVLKLVEHENIICSSTNPTLPFSINTALEHPSMIMTVHRLSAAISSDRDIAYARVRAYTMAAEGVLHDMGAISVVNSDAQGMGRIGETIQRTWQLADRMKKLSRFGIADAPPEFREGNDNDRVLRYIAKYTINPAIAHGISDYVGSIHRGKLADLVLWRPGFFGVKPEAVYKCGFAVWGLRGDGNGSTRSCQPLTYGPQFGSLGDAPSRLGLGFVSKACLESLERRSTGQGLASLRRRLVPVRGTRQVSRKAMIRNAAVPKVEINDKEEKVYVNGRLVNAPPAEKLPLSRLYVLG